MIETSGRGELVVALPFPGHGRRYRLPAAGSLRVVLHAAPRHASRDTTAEVDLGCLYELTDRRSGVVQALGGLYGAFDRPPFVQLERDDRAWSGAGQNLFINLDRAVGLRRLLVFVYARRGPLAAVRITVDFNPSGASPFRVALRPIPAAAHACAIAAITPDRTGRIIVGRDVRFVPGFQEQLDRAYGFGLRWATARQAGLG